MQRAGRRSNYVMVRVLLVATAFGFAAASAIAADKKIKREKLQIVFLMGQSNMVGLSDVSTGEYLFRPTYVPPKDIVTAKSRYFNWNFYWSGVDYYVGPRKAELDSLVEERRASRAKWRQRTKDANGPWKEKEWGPKPEGGRGNMYPFLDGKAEEEGIYKRMAEILDSKENQFTIDDAYEEVLQRDKDIAEELELIREVYFKGTTEKDFAEFKNAVAEAIEKGELVTKVGKGAEFTDAEKNRSKYAELAKKYLNMPIGERTYIYAYGHVTGSHGEQNKHYTQGPLSVGYGGALTTIGPEYGVGVALERMIDAPILLVKCSWGNTALGGAWKPPTLDGVETPTQKSEREAWNKRELETAKKEGREPRLREAPKKTGELTYCWGMTLPQIDKVLADPGKFHPEYDPKVGYEVAGMVWFQGYSDKGNVAYGEQLVELVKFMREKVKTPNMPFVAGTLGMSAFKNSALSGEVNGGMVYASQQPEMTGTVDVVNTAPYYPLELDLLNQVLKTADKESPEYKEALKVKAYSVSNHGFHYHGNTKCFLLMGDAMGRSLFNLMAGGTPMITDAIRKAK